MPTGWPGWGEFPTCSPCFTVRTARQGLPHIQQQLNMKCKAVTHWSRCESSVPSGVSLSGDGENPHGGLSSLSLFSVDIAIEWGTQISHTQLNQGHRKNKKTFSGLGWREGVVGWGSAHSVRARRRRSDKERSSICIRKMNSQSIVLHFTHPPDDPINTGRWPILGWPWVLESWLIRHLNSSSPSVAYSLHVDCPSQSRGRTRPARRAYFNEVHFSSTSLASMQAFPQSPAPRENASNTRPIQNETGASATLKATCWWGQAPSHQIIHCSEWINGCVKFWGKTAPKPP